MIESKVDQNEKDEHVQKVEEKEVKEEDDVQPHPHTLSLSLSGAYYSPRHGTEEVEDEDQKTKMEGKRKGEAAEGGGKGGGEGGAEGGEKDKWPVLKSAAALGLQIPVLALQIPVLWTRGNTPRYSSVSVSGGEDADSASAPQVLDY
jgi:hypothetical protein